MMYMTNDTNKQPTRHQRRFDRTRAKLLSSARTVFSEKGLSASVDDITERADVARGSFYYHFRNKERLIQILMDQVISDLMERMNKECSDKNSLESVLDGIIQAHIRYFSDRWEDFVLYYQGRADLTLEESYDGLEKPILKYAKGIEELIDASITEPIAAGKIRRLASAIAGFVAGYYSFASIASTDQDIESEFQSLRSAFVLGLARFAKETLPNSQVRW